MVSGSEAEGLGMVGMGNETLNTVKGHGFAVGDQVEFYGMGSSEFGPTNEPTLCVLTKLGNKYVLTYTATVKGDAITWEFGPAAKIWASKVETVTPARPVTAEVASEAEIADAIDREVFVGGNEGGSRDVQRQLAAMRLAAVGQPETDPASTRGRFARKTPKVQAATECVFSGHSRRPMECRLCGRPAEVHSTTTDEGSSRQMWIKARTPLVTDQIKAWSGRTARVLEAIAELGGTVNAWDLGSGRGWHKTAVRIVMDSGVLVDADPSKQLAKTYVLSDMGRQACEWYGFTIAEPVKPVTAEEVESAYAVTKQNGRVFAAEAHNFVRPEAFVQAVTDGLLTLVDNGDMSRYVPTRRTADGVIITQGLPVWDYNVEVGTVDLTQISSDGWFHVLDPTGKRQSLMNAERVVTRHPFSRALASDVLAAMAKPATVEIHTGDGTVITGDDVKARFAVAFGDAKKLGKVWSSSGRLIDPVEPIPANPEPFSDRDMRDQIIAYLGSDVDAYYVDGIVDHIIRLQGGAIDINKINPDKFTQVLDMFAKTSEPSEEEVRSGTDTLIKPSIRTGLARRKRKATKKARRMVKGGF